jgi:hypothetical protein
MAPMTRYARELDVSALIALWLAIHGGDPAPSEVRIDNETTLLIAAALDRQLATTLGANQPTEPAELVQRLEAFGIESSSDLTSRDSEEANRICWKVPIIDLKTGKPTGGYMTICVEVRFPIRSQPEPNP